ncbi:MAG: anti-sigma factor antagonist [Chitinivibrionales bacterium]|nr:anti-sigma factor antagonist [Chitinivibrionales bacterium]MBD3395710.1 anti-sigma factor antagonist [Chitinivibrionales bacterium]
MSRIPVPGHRPLRRNRVSCKVKLQHKNALPVVQVIGELTGNDSARVSKKILAQRAGKSKMVVVDLSETTFLDSHGLGVLVYAWRRLEERDQELVFMNPPPFVQNIFQGTNLANVLRVVESLDAL